MNDPVTVSRIGIDARMAGHAFGGIGRYVRELLRHLAAADPVSEYRVYLAEDGLREWVRPGPNFTPVSAPYPAYSPAEQLSFLRLLNSEACDLVHFANFNRPALYRRPCVVTVHDFTQWHRPNAVSLTGRGRQAAFRLLMHASLRGASRVVSISEFTVADAERTVGLGHAAMEVIYEGGPQRMEPAQGAKAALQSYLGSRDPYFLFLSTWKEHKGLRPLLAAFAQIKEAGLPHNLILAGNAGLASGELIGLVESHPFRASILTPGFLPEEHLPSAFKYATAFVFPSLAEGFGLPLLEAFAFGAPVITTTAACLPEIAGDAALLVPPDDAEALASAMRGLAADPSLRRGLIEAGAERLKKFSWERCAVQTLGVYRTVLAKGR